MGYGEVRTVYAILPNGLQIVRYSVSKRWFLEDASGQRLKRYRKVSDAAQAAAVLATQVFLGRPDGKYFDKYYRGFTEGPWVPPVRRYTAAGLRQAIAREQVKYDRAYQHWRIRKNFVDSQIEQYSRWYGERRAQEMANRYWPLPPAPQMDPYLRKKAG